MGWFQCPNSLHIGSTAIEHVSMVVSSLTYTKTSWLYERSFNALEKSLSLMRMDIRETGWEGVDWMILVQGRNQWQARTW